MVHVVTPCGQKKIRRENYDLNFVVSKMFLRKTLEEKQQVVLAKMSLL